MKNREPTRVASLPARISHFARSFHGRVEERNRPGIRQKLYFHGWPFVNAKEADLKRVERRKTFLHPSYTGENWVVGLVELFSKDYKNYSFYNYSHLFSWLEIWKQEFILLMMIERRGILLREYMDLRIFNEIYLYTINHIESNSQPT